MSLSIATQRGLRQRRTRRNSIRAALAPLSALVTASAWLTGGATLLAGIIGMMLVVGSAVDYARPFTLLACFGSFTFLLLLTVLRMLETFGATASD